MIVDDGWPPSCWRGPVVGCVDHDWDDPCTLYAPDDRFRCQFHHALKPCARCDAHFNQGDITMPTPEPRQIWRQGNPHRVITARVVEVDDGWMVIAVDDKQDPYRVWTVRSFMANWEPVPPPPIVLRSSSIEAMTFTNPTRTQVVMWADGYPLPLGSLKEGKRYKITLEEES